MKSSHKPLLVMLMGVLLLSSCTMLGSKGSTQESTLTGMSIAEVQADSKRHESTTPHKPVIAIALGGGGMRGYAHIGVLQALEALGIKPDIVVGTSIGAVVGAPYAAGISAAQLWKVAETTQVSSFADVTLSGPGFIKGKALADWINHQVGNVPIEQFPKQFAAVATDIEHAQALILVKGDAGMAVRASAAIPGIFLPLHYKGDQLVDGGITSVVPVRAAKAMGADIVIGVDIYCHSPRFQANGIVSTILWVTQTQSCMISQNEMAEADILVTPSVTAAGMDDAAGREQARQIGYDAAMSQASQIQALLAHWHKGVTGIAANNSAGY